MVRTRRKHNAPKGSTREKGDILEKIIAEMHDIPGVKIERNVYLPTLDGSSRTREIDILITGQMAGFQIQIAVECKNKNKVTGVEQIDEFIGKLQDVGIPTQLGLFVSMSKYTSGAVKRAKSVGIRTFLLQDISADLPQAVKEAYQSNVYLMLTITNVVISNDISDVMWAGELLFFRDESGNVSGVVGDLVWKEWISGRLSSQIGNHEVSLTLPSDWRQIVQGKNAKVSEIKVSYKVTGYAISFPGAVSQYNLVNVEDNKIEKSQTVARFPPPIGKYPLVHFQTKDELDLFRNQIKGIGVIFESILPRIVWYASYWPPSKKAIEKLNKKLIESLKKGEEFDLRSVSLLEIEGDDLAAMWEPIIEDHPLLSKNLPSGSA
jgi:hypothetical protein